MNWERGLLRTWIVFTVPWVLICGCLGLIAWSNDGSWRRIETDEFGHDLWWSLIPPSSWVALAVAIVVPAGVVAVGFGIKWAASGFRS